MLATYLEAGAASSWSSVPDASLFTTDDSGRRFAAADAGVLVGCTTVTTTALLLPGGPRRSSASIISMLLGASWPLADDAVDHRKKLLAGGVDATPIDDELAERDDGKEAERTASVRRMLGLHCSSSSFGCVPWRLAYIEAVATCQ